MFKVIKGDITHLPFSVDAIVNPSNTELILGGGVSGAIAKSMPLEDYVKLQNAMLELAPIKVGEAVTTYTTNPKIIHVAGPRKYEDDDTLLSKAYLSVFETAVKEGFETIACPLISAGIFGFSEDESFREAQYAAKKFPKLNIIMIIWPK